MHASEWGPGATPTDTPAEVRLTAIESTRTYARAHTHRILQLLIVANPTPQTAPAVVGTTLRRGSDQVVPTSAKFPKN